MGLGYCYPIALGGGVVGVRVSMAKSWVIKAEQPTVSDLSTERSILGGGSSFSRRRNLVFIVNPRGLSLTLSICICICVYTSWWVRVFIFFFFFKCGIWSRCQWQDWKGMEKAASISEVSPRFKL